MIGDFFKVDSKTSFLKVLLVFLLLVLIHTFVVRFLWNGVLVKHITIFKRVDTLWETLLLAIALSLFSGSCVCTSS